MRSSQDLITVLEAGLRRIGLTCADVAPELGLAARSLERLYPKGDMPLSRIDPVRTEAKMDFAELARAFVPDPRPLPAAICTPSQWTPEPVTDTCMLGKPQAVACLLPLDIAQQHPAGHTPPAPFRTRPRTPA